MRRDARAGQAVEPGGDPLGRPQPLVRAEPPDLGHHPLQGADLALRGVVDQGTVGDRPGRRQHGLAAAERGPQLVGDERDDRVQQP